MGKKIDWNKQYEKISEGSVAINRHEFLNESTGRLFGRRMMEQDIQPVQPDAGQGQQAPAQGPQSGQETGHSDDWNGIKDQVGEFVQQSIQDLYNSVEDPDKQNDLVNRVIGPAIKTVLLNNPNANIPYKEIHNMLKGGQSQEDQGGQEAPPAEGQDQGGQEAPPQQGGQVPPPPAQ